MGKDTDVSGIWLSLRHEDGVTVTPGRYGVEVESIALRFGPAARTGADR